MYNHKNKPPFVFVNFRKVLNDNRIIAVFNQTYDPLQDQITIFDIDTHINVNREYILTETGKAARHECSSMLDMLLNDYQVIADELPCEIRCIPVLPEQFR